MGRPLAQWAAHRRLCACYPRKPFMATVTRATQLLLATLKEAPADAVAPSHQLLVRAGFVRQLGAGLYSLLPLGRRTLARIERILREEMHAVGAEELLAPAL